MVNGQPELLSIAEACELLHAKKTTVYKWIQHGTLPSIHIGAHGRAIRREDALAFVRPKRGRPPFAVEADRAIKQMLGDAV